MTPSLAPRFPALVPALFLFMVAAHADSCQVQDHYGYRYNGQAATVQGPVTFTETGDLSFHSNGTMSGVGELVFAYDDFAGQGPLWLHLRETQSQGVLQSDVDDPCRGRVDFLADATVIQSSNPALVPPGTVLYSALPRAVAYTLSGRQGHHFDMVSLSPGTVASGTARSQKRP